MKNKFLSFIIVCVTLIASNSALAEDITVEGMHCSACKKMITKTVCEDKDLKAQFESCKVELVDAKKQIGKISVKTKNNMPIDYKAIEAAVKNAGDDYKVLPPVVVPVNQPPKATTKIPTH